MRKKIIGRTVGTTMNPDKFGGSDVDLSDYAKKEDLNLKADLVDGKIPIEQLPDGIVSDGFTPDVPSPDVNVSVDTTKVVATAELEFDTFDLKNFFIENYKPNINEIVQLVNQGVDVEIHCKSTNPRLVGDLVLKLEAFNSSWARFSTVTGLFTNENGSKAYSVIYVETTSVDGFVMSTMGRTFLSLSGDPSVGSGGDSSDGGSGEDGKSAYEIAVDNGFEGTVTEWLDSLKGEKGDKGDTYTLTNDDKNDIADVVIAKLPVWQGGSY